MSAHALVCVLLVVYTVTPSYVPGLVKSAASVRRRYPSHIVHVHVLADEADAPLVQQRLHEGGDWFATVHVATCPFSTETGWDAAPEWYRYLRSPSIWLRLCIADTLTGVSREILYLDADTVVQHTPLAPQGQRGVAAVFDSNNMFHTGVLWLHLGQWRQTRKSERITPLLRALPEGGVADTWVLNQLFAADEVEPLDPRWNVMGLGEYRRMPPALLDRAWVLHWTGPRKPWKHKGLHMERWRV